MEQFRNIGLIGRMGSAQVVDTVRRLKKFLAGEGYQLIIEENIASLMPGHGMQVSSVKMMGEVCDLVIVVGGDGSLLGAARELARSDVPLLGVNRGRLGFLTDISPDDMEQQVSEVLAGKYIQEQRFLLDGHIKRNGEPIGYGSCLNDIVLHPGKSTRMIAFDLYIEGQFVYSLRADGLIVSTPTGSTAYAMSAGGPLLHPKLDAIVLVPMHPHTLSSRPIVVDGKSEIKIIIDPTNGIYPQVSFDGQHHIATVPGDTLSITKKPQKVRLIHPTTSNFYETCREKLGWASNSSLS